MQFCFSTHRKVPIPCSFNFIEMLLEIVGFANFRRSEILTHGVRPTHDFFHHRLNRFHCRDKTQITQSAKKRCCCRLGCFLDKPISGCWQRVPGTKKETLTFRDRFRVFRIHVAQLVTQSFPALGKLIILFAQLWKFWWQVFKIGQTGLVVLNVFFQRLKT